ncbi:ENHANCED DISEASE RESISTANCE 2 [Spatholobus suberectus]|nr:ENHANCED DISEASE RESISTANCE 2 [Spatholobus suberectus]
MSIGEFYASLSVVLANTSTFCFFSFSEERKRNLGFELFLNSTQDKTRSQDQEERSQLPSIAEPSLRIVLICSAYSFTSALHFTLYRQQQAFMASIGDRKESEWVDRIISEGAVPLLEPDNCSNGWATPPGDAFMVRGPEYFTTRVKVPAGDYLLKPLGFDWIKSSVKIGEILNNPNSRVRKVIDNEFPAGDKPFVWAFNLQVPTKDNYSAIAYFATKEPVVEDSLMDKFLKGDNAFRNSRLKLIANIVKGPWIVRKAVGEQAICIIGRALSCKYCTGENFMEVDIDIGSSMVASAIVHLAFGYISTLTVDLAFLIESQAESELPEKILGAFRFSDLDPASARTIEPSTVVSCDDIQTSLPTRLWKSIGQGFSHILHSVPQEDGSASGSQHAKIVVDNKDNPTDDKNW